jgi:hypothetical protein
MNFGKWKLNEDATKMLSFTASAAGVCVARVACEDIRQKFAVPHASNELLCDLATQREANSKTLSEIANSLFDAGRHTLIKGFLVVSQSVLIADCITLR